MAFEKGAARAWKNPWAAGSVFIVAAVLLVYWYFHIPPSGYSITCMAVTAALMGARTEMSARERMVWILVIFAFALAEIRAVKHDRLESEKAQKEFANEQRRHFNEIGEGIKQTIEASDKNSKEIGQGIEKAIRESNNNFQATMMQTNKLLHSGEKTAQIATHAVEAVTGGESYPFVKPTSRAPGMKVYLQAEIRNSQDAGGFSYKVARVAEKGCPFVPTIQSDDSAEGETGYFRGTLFIPAILSPALQGVTRYWIRMQAKNGIFYECLDLKLDSSKQSWDHRIWVSYTRGFGVIGIKGGSETFGDWSQDVPSAKAVP